MNLGSERANRMLHKCSQLLSVIEAQLQATNNINVNLGSISKAIVVTSKLLNSRKMAKRYSPWECEWWYRIWVSVVVSDKYGVGSSIFI